MNAELTRLCRGWVRKLPNRSNGYKYTVQCDSGHFYFVLPAHAGKTVYKVDQPVYLNYLRHGSIAFHAIEPRYQA